MQELVTVLAKALVEKPEAVQVEAVEEEDRTVLKLTIWAGSLANKGELPRRFGL